MKHIINWLGLLFAEQNDYRGRHVSPQCVILRHRYEKRM